MKIVVFGASGAVGNATLREALNRGHSVTAVARDPNRLTVLSPKVRSAPLDLLSQSEAAADLAKGHDILISALRPAEGREADLVPLTRAVLDAARANGIPALITGGAALLKLADGSGHTVLSAPDFLPAEVRPIAEACAAQDALLEQENEACWTCLRPPAMLLEGERCGQYAMGTDTLVTDMDGQSQISYADFAVAMMDLAEAPQAPRRRLTAGWVAPAPALQPA